MVFGPFENQSEAEACIVEQIEYFSKRGVPFVWYLDENHHQDLKDRLIDCGFIDEGVFQGMILKFKIGRCFENRI